MGLFDLIKPQSIEKMVADNNIEGLVNLLDIPQYRITQEKIDRAGQAQAAIRKLANEKNAQYLVQKILDCINKNDNPDFYFKALGLMRMESQAIKPLIARLMTYYYYGGMDINHLSSVNFDELHKKIRLIYDYLIQINDKQIIKPLLLEMADQYFSSNYIFIAPVNKRLILFGNDAKIQLQEIISAPDSEIYLNTLIEDLFQTYNVIGQIEPKFRIEFLWNKRVEYLINMLRGYDKSKLVKDPVQRYMLETGNAIHVNPSKILRNYASTLLEQIEKER